MHDFDADALSMHCARNTLFDSHIDVRIDAREFERYVNCSAIRTD
jgi:hypothetical protein